MQIKSHYRGQFRTRVFNESQLDKNGDLLPGVVPLWNSGFNDNMILDTLFETNLNGTGGNKTRAALLQYLAASSDTTAPSAGDTSVTEIGTRFGLYTPACTCTISGNKIIQILQFRSTKGQIIGTVGKVALFELISGGQTNVASLIKDSGGSATTLPLGANDYFYVDWKTETTINTSDVTGTITVPGEGDYNYVMRPCYWNDTANFGSSNPLACYSLIAHAGNGFGFNRLQAFSTQTLGAITAGPAGAGTALINLSMGSYTAGSKERDVEYYATETDINIAGGIGSIILNNSGSSSAGYQISFEKTTDGSKLNKINTKELRLLMTYAFSR